jgi:hypothetical protein
VSEGVTSNENIPPTSNELPTTMEIDKPNAARIYDYMLGGSHNFEVDRTFAEDMMAATNSTPRSYRMNRSFLRRAVKFMVDDGIDQFLDLGSGIPTVGNVHEIAQAINPDVRVVYVDNELVAVSHSRRMLADNPNAVMIDADLRDSRAVLGHPQTQRMLDFTRPIGLLMVAIFHFIPDRDRPVEIVERYRAALRGGGFLAMSHFTGDDQAVTLAANGTHWYQQTANPLVMRTRTEFEALLTDVELIPPGVSWVQQWRSDNSDPELEIPSESAIYAAVGRLAAGG